jgi:predicted membrane channel-forming protein YqfA (hemolysin III family)
VGFFVARRRLLLPSETERSWGSCALGIFRFEHADGIHSPLRTSTYVCLAFASALSLPVALEKLPWEAVSALIWGNVVGFAVLVLGMLVDNTLRYPDKQYQDAFKLGRKVTKTQNPALSQLQLPPCHSQSCGCMCSSHAIWHTAALFSVICSFVGRELALAQL